MRLILLLLGVLVLMAAFGVAAHEVGHAIQHGYRLQRRRRWQNIFGRSSDPYPDYYRPNPASPAR